MIVIVRNKGNIMKKRNNFETVFNILSVINNLGNHAKPTHVLVKANLSNASLKNYRKILEKNSRQYFLDHLKPQTVIKKILN